jgi:UDP-glucose 4-epimerase
MLASSVDGTRNLAEAARAAAVEHVIHVSSLAVYDYDRVPGGSSINELTPLEPQPARRGGAALAKRRAEDIALANLASDGPAWTILRPSYVLGRGRDLASALGSRKGNRVLSLGGRRRHLRLVHVDDVAGAIEACLATEGTRGKVYVLSDPEPLRARRFVREALRVTDPSIKVMWLHRWFVGGAVLVLKFGLRLMGRRLGMNRARLNYLFKDATADPSRLMADTGWRPAGPLLSRLASPEPTA